MRQLWACMTYTGWPQKVNQYQLMKILFVLSRIKACQ